MPGTHPALDFVYKINYHEHLKCLMKVYLMVKFFQDSKNFNRHLTTEEKKIFTSINPKTKHPSFP